MSSGHFVQDEASQAQARGVLLPVAIDPVRPPLGFGQHQALSLAGWSGSRRDPRFADVLAAVRAIVAGGPRAAPTARARRRPGRRGLIAAGVVGAVVAILAAVSWLAGPARLCGLLGLRCGALASPTSLAVLPFENLSGDPAQAYFADGLTEEMISALARLKPLSVIARTSSFRFRGSHESPQAIGAALHVGSLLDGSVRRQGNVVRVTASLADAATGLERWSETYDREVKDIFAVQSGIAQAVAEALRVKLLGGDIAALSGGDTLSPEAYDAYLRGSRAELDAAGEADLRAAVADLDRAIAADPRFAKAWSRKASALAYLADRYAPSEQVGPTYGKALAAAAEGVDLAPNLPEGQAVYASLLVFARLDFTGAAAAFRKARALAPNNAVVLTGYGQFECQVGRCADGAALLARAAQLDPLNPRAFFLWGTVLLYARRYDPAEAAFRRALALSPGLALAHGFIGYARLLRGDLAGARDELGREQTGWARLTGLAILAHRQGDDAGARRLLTQLTASEGDSGAYQQAQVLAQLGEAAGAVAALGRAERVHDAGLTELPVDPFFDPIREDPRLVAFAPRKATPLG